MMEPVAWLVKTRMGTIAWATWQPSGEPLVRLSDAEARIKELEAKLAEADALIEAQQHDFAQNNIRNAENAHRAEAAEALLKEARDNALNEAVRWHYAKAASFKQQIIPGSKSSTTERASLAVVFHEGAAEAIRARKEKP